MELKCQPRFRDLFESPPRDSRPRGVLGRRALAFLAVLLGFGGLAGGSSGGRSAPADFQPAQPGYVWQFPRDHGAHADFRTEWWYYSGHLTSPRQERFGYQLTFFRVGLSRSRPPGRSAWISEAVYFAHLALTDVNGRTFTYREKAQRGALGLAGAEPGRLHVWVEDWRAEASGEHHHLRAAADGLAVDLRLTPQKPPVFHGEGGFSRKAAGFPHASHYYSLTRLATQGTLTISGREIPVQGQSWLDREFSSSQLAPHQAGWDWFALQLSDGSDLMFYRLRLREGGLDPASAGTYIDPEGRTRNLGLADVTLKINDFWRSPATQARYPAAWEIEIPSLGYRLHLQPTLADQELVTKASTQVIYWEGQVKVQGNRNGLSVHGLGYVELTGYAGPLGGRF